MKKSKQTHTPQEVCAQILEDGVLTTQQLPSLLEYHRHCLNTRGELHYSDAIRRFVQIWQIQPESV